MSEKAKNGKKDKKKPYVPKPVRLDNMAWLMNGMLPVNSATSTMQTLRIINHGAMHSIVHGKGVRQDAVMLRSAFITARALAMTGVKKQNMRELISASESVNHLITRGDTTGRYVFKGPEMSDVNLGLEIHESQLNVCTIAKLEEAVALARRVVSKIV